MEDMIQKIEPLIPALRRYARGLLRDRSAADDLLQDCLEKAITRWHQRRAEGEVRPWLFAILHNLAINRMRQNQRRGQHIAIDDAPETALGRPAPQESALTHRDLQGAIAALSQDQRAVLLLVSVEDLSYAEAARALGVPVGTIMSRLARARERVAYLMEGKPESVPHLRRVK